MANPGRSFCRNLIDFAFCGEKFAFSPDARGEPSLGLSSLAKVPLSRTPLLATRSGRGDVGNSGVAFRAGFARRNAWDSWICGGVGIADAACALLGERADRRIGGFATTPSCSRRRASSRASFPLRARNAGSSGVAFRTGFTRRNASDSWVWGGSGGSGAPLSLCLASGRLAMVTDGQNG